MASHPLQPPSWHAPRLALWTALALAAPSALGTFPVESQDQAFFEQRILPLLERRCFECHSHAAEKSRGGLVLDSRSGWQTGGEHGPSVLPGDVAGSLLIQAVRHTHEDIRMPKEKLPAAEIALLEEWVRRGAPDPRVTSRAQDAMAQRLERARREHWSFQPLTSPPPPQVSGATHPIDRFIRARLAREGLAPSPRADPRQLIRRASFILIGLPPTFEQIETFAANSQPDALERLADRLLAQPEYGQRWARHWLDVARYADTVEASTDSERRIPFAHTYRDYVVDAFNADKPFDQFVREQLAADRLPGSMPLELRALGWHGVGRAFSSNADGPALRVDDRIDVLGRGLLGLTLACARCHDHKFDAVPTQDYYSLAGILDSFESPVDLPALPRPGATPSAAEKEHAAKRVAALAAYEAHIDACLASSRAHLETFTTEYLQYLVRRSPQHRTTQGDIPLDTPRGWLVYRAPDRWQALLDQCRQRDEPFFRLWHQLIALPRDGFAPAAQRLLASGLPGHPPEIVTAFRDRAPRDMLDVAEIYGSLIKAALAQPGSPTATLVFGPGSPVPPRDRYEIREDLHRFLNEKELVNRSDGEKAGKLLNDIRLLDIAGPTDRAMTVALKPRLEPARVLVRGDLRQPGEPVPRRFLQVLASVDSGTYADDGRLSLARAVASPRNPLTARVLVNRVWQHHFGTGLVATPDDFGATGEKPSHPELLDHLASWFIHHGWSIKALHRYLISSQTWQQSAQARPEALEKDPANRLLWRSSPRQLEFEPLRDALLHVADRLDTRLGGRGTPLDATHHRRALYGFTDRFRIPALLRNFNVANPDTSISRRPESVLPVQALFLMNNPFVWDQARAIAAHPQITQPREDVARVDALFRRILGRQPDASESQASLAFLNATASDASRWAALAQSLLLSNEFASIP